MEEKTKKVEQRVVQVRKGSSNEAIIQLPREKRAYSATVLAVRSVCFWVMIISSLILLIIGIVSIWTDLSEIFGKSFLTFIIVMAVTGFIALIAPLLDKKEQ